jgi:hypothetical protein
MTIIGPYYSSHGLLTNGHAATRDEAMAKFRASWERMRVVGRNIRVEIR